MPPEGDILETNDNRIKLSAILDSGKLGIQPGKLTGNLSVPQSKSLAHRALIMAFLCGDLSLAVIEEKYVSEDIDATRQALEKLLRAMESSDHSSEPIEIDCRESGSTLRFLIPLVAILGVPTRFIGRGRLPKRPIKEYENVFRGSGAEMIYEGEAGDSLPLLIKGKMQSGEYALPGNVSSQYISGLLMALSKAEGASRIRLTTELESLPYVNMTIAVMKEFGVEVVPEEGAFFLPGISKPERKTKLVVEADYSQAAFWLVANYLGSAVCLMNLPKKTAQGDRAIESLISGLMHAGNSRTEDGSQRVFEMDARDVPDLVPVFAVAAAATDCETHIVHAERLALKESDRLASTAQMLEVLGCDVKVRPDGMTIRGRAIVPGKSVFSGGTVDTHNDHRLVMASAVAAVCADAPIWIQEPKAVEKSYPAFFEDYLDVGGSIYGINVG